jgi:hypothetical protein
MDRIELASCGGLAGMLLFVIYNAYLIFADHTANVDPFAYSLIGLTASILGGALLFGAIDLLRDRFAPSPHPENFSDEWEGEGAESTEYFNDVIIPIRCRPPAGREDESGVPSLRCQPASKGGAC